MLVSSRLRTSPGPRLGPSEAAFKQLSKKVLLVGIPGDSAPRAPEPGQKGTPPSNAVIGYIQEFGDDELHIPPRPFLVPGVRAVLPAITRGLHKAAVSAFSGKPGQIRNGFDEAGLAAQASVKATMDSGPFAPLSQRTIEGRARRRNSETGKLLQDGRSRAARKFLAGQAAGQSDAELHAAGFAKPLVDTGSLRTAVQYVVKEGR